MFNVINFVGRGQTYEIKRPDGTIRDINEQDRIRLSIFSARAETPAMRCISRSWLSKSIPTNRVVSIVGPIAAHQPIFMVHKADEYRWDGMFGRYPKRMNRKQTAAVADEADSVLSRRQPDADAERHRPTHPAAAGREMDSRKPARLVSRTDPEATVFR